MRNALFALSAIVVLAAGPARAQAPKDAKTAQEIMDTMLDSDSLGFATGEARVKLTIQNKRGQERVRVVNSKSIEVDDLRWSLVTFLEPADVAGTRLLAKEQAKGGDLQYLYLPALKEKRRIAGAAKNESFMGTDFTYNDLEQRGMEEARYERLPDEKHSGIDAFVILAHPTGDDSEYSKIKVWVDQKDYLPLKAYFYDKKGDHLKTMVAQMIEPLGGKLSITRLLMKNVKKGSRTTMEIKALDRNKSFPESLFDESRLDK